jgi:cell division protein FtsL
MVTANKNRKLNKHKKHKVLQATWPRRWLIGAVIVSAFGLAAILHVRTKLIIVKLGYQLSEVTREHNQLLAQTSKLQVEAATLRNPRRLRVLASQQYLLDEPTPKQYVKVDSQTNKVVAGWPAERGSKAE